MQVRDLGSWVAGNPVVRLARQCLKAAAYTSLAAGRLLVAPPHSPDRTRPADRVHS